MDEKGHQERHKLLHKHLDELFADFAQYENGKTTDTIYDLLMWSKKQMDGVDHPVHM